MRLVAGAPILSVLSSSDETDCWSYSAIMARALAICGLRMTDGTHVESLIREIFEAQERMLAAARHVYVDGHVRPREDALHRLLFATCAASVDEMRGGIPHQVHLWEAFVLLLERFTALELSDERCLGANRVCLRSHMTLCGGIVSIVKRVSLTPESFRPRDRVVLHNCSHFNNRMGPLYSIAFHPGWTGADSVDTAAVASAGNVLLQVAPPVEEEFPAPGTDDMVNRAHARHLSQHLLGQSAAVQHVWMPESRICRGPGMDAQGTNHFCVCLREAWTTLMCL